MASCIFCGSPHTSREHIWPQWVSEILAERGSFRLEAEQVNVRSWTQTSRNVAVITKRVCTTCNNGWMSQLETQVRPTLEPMLRGNYVRISSEQQLVLVRWIVKTAMVLEHIGAAVRRKFFSQTEYLGIRTAQALPERLYVWLSHVVDPTVAASASEDDFTFQLDDHPDAEPGVGYTSTLSAGEFAFQLVCLRPHDLLVPDIEVEFTNEEGWEGYSVQLWPIISECYWPPTQSLDHGHLKQYGTRFARGTKRNYC